MRRLPHRLGILLPSMAHSAAEFRKHRRGLVGLAEQVWALADQEVIAILVDSGMEIVVGEES